MVRIHEAVEGREGKDETRMSAKHRTIELSAEITEKLYEVEDKVDPKLLEVFTVVFSEIENTMGSSLTRKQVIAAGCGMIVMRLVRMELVSVGVEPHEPTADEMLKASVTVQKALASAVYDVGSRVFQSRAERN